MQDERKPAVGDLVVFHDEQGKPFNALVTIAWSGVCTNMVIVSGDESKQDQYGRQLERKTSCNHMSVVSAHGLYWRWPDETPRPYVPPVAK